MSGSHQETPREASRFTPAGGVVTFFGAAIWVQCAGLVATAFTDRTAFEGFWFTTLALPDQAGWALDCGIAITLLALATVSWRWRWSPVAYGVMGVWFAILAALRTHLGGQAFSDLALISASARWGAPLILALLLMRRAGDARLLLRVVLGATFIAHGWEALCAHPVFVDYILIADLRLAHTGIDQPQAELILTFIGALDVLLGALVLGGVASRWLLGYMALWGALTAGARVVHSGLFGLDEMLLRSPHAALPIVLLGLPRKAPEFQWSPALPSPLRWAALGVLVALVTLGGGQSIAQEELVPHQWRVVWGSSPAEEALISWSTGAAGSTHTVHYDTEPRGGVPGDYGMEMVATRNGRYSGGDKHYHHATLAELLPSTRYYFVIVSDERISEELYFTTAPVDDRPFALLFGGDSRSGRDSRQDINRRIAELAGEHPEVIAFAHGGDFVNNGGDWDQWDDWLSDHELTVRDDGQVLPIIPTRGNHEGNAELFNEVFGFPGGDDVDYFATRLGRQLTWITLDSNESLGGTQRDWLAEQLEGAETRWVVPSYHRPAFPAVKSPGGALEHWVPLFEEHDLVLACESDGHVLKRTVPIRDGEASADGVVYVGEGGLGVSQRSPDDDWYLQGEGMAMSTHHVQLLNFGPDALRYRAIAEGGELVDDQIFAPRRVPAAGAPTVVAATATGATAIEVVFSEAMDAASLEAGTYVLEGADVLELEVRAANQVALRTSPLTPGVSYILSIEGLESAAGIPLEAATRMVRFDGSNDEGSSDIGGSGGSSGSGNTGSGANGADSGANGEGSGDADASGGGSGDADASGGDAVGAGGRPGSSLDSEDASGDEAVLRGSCAAAGPPAGWLPMAFALVALVRRRTGW